MRHKTPSRHRADIATVRRRRREAVPPAVPIFQPDPEAKPVQPETEQDPAEDAVRRMVEAAYT